jgi:hypothetical protein
MPNSGVNHHRSQRTCANSQGKDAPSLLDRQPRGDERSETQETAQTRSKQHTPRFVLQCISSLFRPPSPQRLTDITQTPINSRSTEITTHPNTSTRTRHIPPNKRIIRIRTPHHLSIRWIRCIGAIDDSMSVDVDRTWEQSLEDWWV